MWFHIFELFTQELNLYPILTHVFNYPFVCFYYVYFNSFSIVRLLKAPI